MVVIIIIRIIPVRNDYIVKIAKYLIQLVLISILA